MGGNIIMLDACAILVLRMSEPNPRTSDNSIYQLIKDKESKKMQEIGEKLHLHLSEAHKKGAKFCATSGAWEIARFRYDTIIKRLAQGYVQFRRALWIFDNNNYRDDLRSITRHCFQVSKKRFKEIRDGVKGFYERWQNDKNVLNCIKKGVEDKTTFPEDEDLIRLSEAIANKEASGGNLLLVTGDRHFICYRQPIREEFDVRLMNYHKTS